MSERTSGQHPRGRQAGSLSPPLALDGPHPLDHPAGQAWSPETQRPLSGPQLGHRGSGRGFCPSRPWSWLHPMPLERMTTVAEPPHTLSQGPALCLLGQAGPPPRVQPFAGRDLEGMCLHPLACPSAFREKRGDGFCGQEGALLEQKASGCGPCSHVWLRSPRGAAVGGRGQARLAEAGVKPQDGGQGGGAGGEWLSH